MKNNMESEADMEKDKRSQYLLKLIRKVTKISTQVYKYQSTPRTYGTEEKLYMREVHFIDILGNGEMEMGQIAERLDVTNGAVSQIASRLEKKGYVIRKKEASDSRHIICALTEKAEKALEQHSKMDVFAYKKFDAIMEEFSEEELVVCDRFLNRIRDFYNMTDLVEMYKSK